MLGELTRKQVELLLANAVVEAKGEYKDPPLDLEAIRERADTLEASDPIKADLYLLLKEVSRLRNGQCSTQDC